MLVVGGTVGDSCSEPDAVPVAKAILVVEDDFLIRLAISDELAALGFHVIQAASADEALRVLQGGVSIDLILTDVRMPGTLDGLELARRVRVNWPNIKVIVVSGDLLSMPSDGSADLFFAKPYNPAYVSDAVKQLLPNPDDQS
jgi:two-component system, response regulator PdtaR